MKTKKRYDQSKSMGRYIILLSLLSFLVILACVCIGRYRISYRELLSLLNSDTALSTTSYNILTHIRIPRALLAYLIGVSLSISGAAYQSLFHNRLVSPGILGVNSGACVGAGICILLGVGTVGRTIVAFIFGIAAACLALVIQKFSKNKSALVLVLAGIVVSALMNAVIGIIKYIADGENQLASITFWMLGSIANAEMKHVYFLFPFVVICTMLGSGENRQSAPDENRQSQPN